MTGRAIDYKRERLRIINIKIKNNKYTIDKNYVRALKKQKKEIERDIKKIQANKYIHISNVKAKLKRFYKEQVSET